MKYRKKPVVIEAIQWNGNNLMEIECFRKGGNLIAFRKSIAESTREFWQWDEYERIVEEKGLRIQTLEGEMKADIGDYIIKGVNGEFYPCKPDIFEKTYEKLSE
ncbi:hypothetical protein [Prevotella pallens]|uniref:Phage protein n=1 Tax=Prevotella pallens TaxID=60133 RepID=A0A379G8Y4_9BACT|nr:hypothetical protein [Prevotella pallens]SUC37499.1 Uncharacterised protein [Prevotella pallens]DAS86820.1 MAG TPA: PGDYG protein [Caudoviricetes sp.]